MYHGAVKHIHTDKLAGIVGGRYALTVCVSKRLRQINSGAPLLVEQRPDERLLDAICREIEEGKIWIERPEIKPQEVSADTTNDISELFEME